MVAHPLPCYFCIHVLITIATWLYFQVSMGYYGMPTDMHWPYIPVNNGVLKNNGFISHSISPVTTKRGRNVIQYTKVINMANICDFISSSISVLTTNFGTIVDQHAIALAEDKFTTNEWCKAQKLQSHWFCCFNLKLTSIREIPEIYKIKLNFIDVTFLYHRIKYRQ